MLLLFTRHENNPTNLIKATETMINVISSRFNFHNMGKIKRKNLNEYVSKLWKQIRKEII